jgi:hypothetical protein
MLVRGKQALCAGFELERPRIRAARVVAPGRGMEVVDQVPASEDQDAIVTERRKALGQVVVDSRWLPPVMLNCTTGMSKSGNI